ncbi:MAG TPA: YgiT-type zinc finger protein [Phycisphaerae bacterium]|jgi:YgiT-type zinc finger domain-containing protein
MDVPTHMNQLPYCVQCGSKRVVRQRVAVRLRNGRVVLAVQADVCLACGTRYYDAAAMDTIEQARFGK